MYSSNADNMIYIIFCEAMILYIIDSIFTEDEDE